MLTNSVRYTIWTLSTISLPSCRPPLRKGASSNDTLPEEKAMLSRDDDILKAAEDWSKAGHGVALATVVETWGSAPRPTGSHLVINDQGAFLGSVSGGCV